MSKLRLMCSEPCRCSNHQSRSQVLDFEPSFILCVETGQTPVTQGSVTAHASCVPGTFSCHRLIIVTSCSYTSHGLLLLNVTTLLHGLMNSISNQHCSHSDIQIKLLSSQCIPDEEPERENTQVYQPYGLDTFYLGYSCFLCLLLYFTDNYKILMTSQTLNSVVC